MARVFHYERFGFTPSPSYQMRQCVDALCVERTLQIPDRPRTSCFIGPYRKARAEWLPGIAVSYSFIYITNETIQP